MPTIDEAIERAARAANPALWHKDAATRERAAKPYTVEFARIRQIEKTRAAISAFLADVPVSEAMVEVGYTFKSVTDCPATDAFKAMSAKIAEEIQ